MPGDDTVFWASQPDAVFRTIVVRPHECDRMFSYLVHPDTPIRFVYKYVVALKDRFHDRSNVILANPSKLGHDAFEKIAIRAGIVKTLFRIAKDESKEMEHVFTSYFALEGLWNLIVNGTPSERKVMMEAFINEHHAIDYCLQTVKSGFFVCHRMVAMTGLRLMAAQCRLFSYLSTEKTSELIKTLCHCILSGPDLWVKQLKDPATTWQSLYCFGNLSAPPSKARKYAPRYYSMYQESAVWTIMELVFIHPFPEQDHYNKLIKHDPEILDLMLSCAKLRRPPCYAQLELDGRITEALILMLNVSSEMVPGIGLSSLEDEEVRTRLENRWEELMVGVGLLVSRPRWAKMVGDVWARIEAEDLDEIHQFLMRAQADYHAMEPYSDKSFYDIALYRGATRNAILRLVATLTFFSDLPVNNLTDTDLLCLLPITHSACQIVKEKDDVRGGQGSLTDLMEVVERRHMTFYPNRGRDQTIILSSKEEEQVLEIHDEVLTGPIAHVRLLISLAKRGLFERVAQHEGEWEGLGIPGGIRTLKDNILSTRDVKRSLALSLKRLGERREDGNRQFREARHLEEARFQYWGAAQLAAALIEFDEVTNGRYTIGTTSLKGKARKELILSLGNAAEMALGLEYWDRALVFASVAVKVAEDNGIVDNSGRVVEPEEDAIGVAVHEKNKRRVDRAKAGIEAKRS